MKNRLFILAASVLFAACSLQNNSVQQGVLSACEAEYFASNAVATFSQINPGGEFSEWIEAKPGKAELMNDIDDNPVLYDVPVVKKGKAIGIVQVLADNTLENPLFRVYVSALLLEYRLQIEQAALALNLKMSGVRLYHPRIIYYDFPERAVAFDTGEKGMETVLVDITTREIVPENGIVPYTKAGKAINTQVMKASSGNVRNIEAAGAVSRANSPEGVITRDLPVPRIAQLDHHLCVPTCIEMIWRYEDPAGALPQGQIRIGGCDFTTGCWNVEYIVGYLNNMGFTSAYHDGRPGIDAIMQEIGNNHPYISLIPTPSGSHARVARGYSKVEQLNGDPANGFIVHFNDPAPANVGDEYWEYWINSSEWGSITMAHEGPPDLLKPDLFVSSIASSQNDYFAGDNCTFTAMIKNIGKNPASGIMVRWDVDGNSITTCTIDTLLQPGCIAESACTWLAYPVTHTIECVVDPDNAIQELDDENNDAEINVYVSYGERPREPTLPDLVCCDISIPENMSAGENRTFTATIDNTGLEYTGGVSVKWYIDGQFIKSTLIGLSFPPGGSQQTSFSWTAYRGEHRVRIDIDPDNQIAEKNEANNSYESDSFYVNDIPDPPEMTPTPKADFSCSGISGPGTVYMGYSYTYATTVHNSGEAAGNVTVTWSVDGSTKSSGGIFLAAGGSASSSFTWTVNASRGDHAISASTGSGSCASKGVYAEMAPASTNPPPADTPSPTNPQATDAPAPQPTPPYCPTCPR
ncbi:MAG: hypothetical protein JW881_07450 [Spirochaetales bacterium]|nr:hypothetical protein [Spirochaetales bacterium]